LESRKYHLQKQIIEALKANDSDLYSLLKSQWAHRFGVESLEELKDLDLNQLNQTPDNLNNQKIDQPQENSFESDELIHKKDGDTQEKEIKTKEFEPINNENDESFKIKTYQIINEENDGSKFINSFKVDKSQPEIEALIPLPPKPKYSYLKKWLLSK
tara:strand:+ start:71 stop:544 length:474 start_codon:yes stop_codon:yes gene_type:complete